MNIIKCDVSIMLFGNGHVDINNCKVEELINGQACKQPSQEINLSIYLLSTHSLTSYFYILLIT